MVIKSFKTTRDDRRRLELLVVEAARRDVNVFAEYVFRVKQQPLHKYLHHIVDGNDRSTFDCPVDHGKTTQFEIIRPTFEIGVNCNELMALVSSSPDLPKRSLKVIRRHIQENERLHRVFPRLRLVENTNQTITVERPKSTLKDPTIVAIGIEGQILGRRWTKLVTDDILRFLTTHTEHMRDVIWKRLNQEIFSRLTKNARHTDIGTPMVATDARHKMRRIAGYLFLRFDGWTGYVHDVNGRVVKKFADGLWPESIVDPVSGLESGWPRDRLEKARREMLGHEFDRQIRCMALAEVMRIFSEHLDFCLRLGQGIEMREETSNNGRMRVAWRRPEPTWRTIGTGVDLAITTKSTSHDTAFFTGAVEDRRLHCLELRRGKIEGPDIIRNMIEIVRRYPAHKGFFVESNQGQRYIQQFADEPGLLEALGATTDEAERIRGRVEPHLTNDNKVEEAIGIRSMGVEFEQKRWPIPCGEDMGTVDLVGEWLDGLKSFDPVNHADDMVIASWLFREFSRSLPGGSSDWSKFGIWVPK